MAQPMALHTLIALGLVASCWATQCLSGYSSCSSGPLATCSSSGGIFGLSGCTRIPRCTTPSSDPAGYVTGGSCTGTSTSMITAAQCTGVTCATDYTGTATDSCAADGGVFTFAGCKPACTLPSTTTGYSTSGCSGTRNSDQCTVTCDAASEYQGIATDTCTTPGGTHTFGGCALKPKCSLPSSTTGYTTTSCDTASANLFESQCSVSCATGYTGTATDSCAADGGAFTFAGCKPACTRPSTTTGYSTSGCSGTRNSDQCTITCAAGYIGTATDTCTTPGGTHTFAGCVEAPKCTLPSSTVGYVTSSCPTTSSAKKANDCLLTCSTGFQISAVSASACPSSCAAGFSNLGSARCSSSTFTVRDCPAPAPGGVAGAVRTTQSTVGFLFAILLLGLVSTGTW